MAVAKLKQQNQKLSNELNELTRILEEAVQKQRKAEIESKRPKFSEQEDKELAQLHSQINHMKKEKTALQRQLSANADSNTTDLENELVYLKRKVKEAEAERNTLKKMQQQHAKTLASINNTEAYKERGLKIREEIKQTRDQYRTFVAKMKEDQDKWKKAHQRMVVLETRKRNASSKHPKEEAKTAPPPKDPTVARRDELSTRLQVLRYEIEQDEKRRQKVVSEAEGRLKTAQDELEALKERSQKLEADLQLQDIKIKELKGEQKKLQVRVD